MGIMTMQEVLRACREFAGYEHTGMIKLMCSKAHLLEFMWRHFCCRLLGLWLLLLSRGTLRRESRVALSILCLP